MPLIEGLFPAELVEEHKAALASGKQQREHISAAYMKLAIYAATNNFAGVDGLISSTMMHGYLRSVMTTFISNGSSTLTRCSPLHGMPSAKPMAETFFRCAIEAGDVEAVRYLSLSPEICININEQVCVADGMQFTPVERSAALHHVSLTRVLVELNADVKKTYNEKYVYDRRVLICSGALDWALLRCYQGEGVSLQMVQALLNAGGTINVNILKDILQPGLSTVIQAIVGALIGASHQVWTTMEVFHEIIHRMDKDTVWVTVQNMCAIGASLTYKIEEDKRWQSVFIIPPYPPRIIDIAAERGDQDLVLLLKAYNIPLTADILTAAVRSANLDLVSCVLKSDAVPQEYSPHFRSTPYAEAIRRRLPEIAGLLMESGCMDQPYDEFTFCATLAAASEVGDFPLVKTLLELSHHTKANVLGYALTQAIAANKTEIALHLLDAGASTSRDCNAQVLGFTCVDGSEADEQDALSYLLRTACRNRNTVLVKALLDHDASIFEHHGPRPIDAAVEWGNQAILESLIAAGSADESRYKDEDRTVSIAVTKKDYESVRLLLRSGLSTGVRSLAKAVQNNDEQMVRELLMYGACPADSNALIVAMDMAPSIFKLLVCETRQRFPQGTSKCCKAILAAVETRQAENVQALLQCVGKNRLSRGDSAVAIIRGDVMLSPLAAAIRRDSGTGVEIVQIILHSGVNLDDIVVSCSERTTSGSMLPQETSLLVAIGTKQLQMVKLLLAWGASVDLPAQRGLKRTPLQRAAELGCVPIVRLLLDQGADVNAPSAARGGGTAAQFAAIGGYIGILELLLSYGAEVTALGSKVYGRSAIEGAAEIGRFDMVKYLVNLGPQIISQLEGAIRLAKGQGHEAIVEVLEPILVRTQHRAQRQEHGINPAEEQFDRVATLATPDFDLEENAFTAHASSAAEEQHAHTSFRAVTSTKPKRPFCDRCSKSFSKASALKRRRMTVHAARDRGDRVECPICSRLFVRLDIMRRHQATHDQSGYEQCDNCLERFRKDYLKSKHSKLCQ